MAFICPYRLNVLSYYDNINCTGWLTSKIKKQGFGFEENIFTWSVMYKVRFYVGFEILFPCQFWLLKIDLIKKPKGTSFLHNNADLRFK